MSISIATITDMASSFITMLLHDTFSELVAILLVTAIIGVMALRFRQPLVIAFIAVGILVGPSALYWVKAADQIHLFAEMGLALLLFVVGLKLDMQLIRAMGPVALTAGLGQVLITSAGGFLLGRLLGFPLLAALYIAVALTFSSTIIIVKLLSDKHETDSLHGRIILGILIVQDLVVVLAMLALSAFGGNTSSDPLLLAMGILLKGVLFLGGIWLITQFILPRLLRILANSTELLMLFSIAWALALAHAGKLLGFGQEMGAFIAGVALASTACREIISAKLVSLRDFLLLFFFLELGSRLNLGALGAQIPVSLILALFVLIGKPLLTMLITGWMGYHKRTGFLVGMSLGQISEFSLIFIAMGATAKHVNSDTVGVVTLVGLITIGLSSYLIQYGQGLYDRLAPYLSVFERRIAHREDSANAGDLTASADIILFGLGEYGRGIAGELEARGRVVLGVDFDPQAVRAWKANGGYAVFGDVEDPEFAALLPLATARWVVSAIHDANVNTALAHAVRHAGYTGNIAFTARERGEGERLLTAHGGLLFVPFEDAAVQAVDLLVAREDEIARDTMDRLIETMNNHFIICGYGRMGQQIAKDFRRQRVPFVVIEDNPEQLPRLKEEGTPFIDGKSSNDTFLLKAGIQRARGLVAVAASDEENVFIVLTARGLNPDLFIIARSIREENEDKLRRAGASRVISPYILGGRRMAAAVTKPGVMDFLDLVLHSDMLDADIGHIAVRAGSDCCGKTLQTLGLWQACGVTVLAVQRPGEAMLANPYPDYVLQQGDELFLLGSNAQLDAAANYFGAPALPPIPVNPGGKG